MLVKLSALQRVSPAQIQQMKLIGPFYHGTTETNFSSIMDEGFTFAEEEAHTGTTRHGFPNVNFGYTDCPVPVHFLGYGTYFTSVKSLARDYDARRSKSEVFKYQFYINAPRLLKINFAASNSMVKWWIKHGYNPEIAKIDRVGATQDLTRNLKKDYDAVFFTSAGIHGARMLDGNQICVYDPVNIFLLDQDLALPFEEGSHVVSKEHGTTGTVQATKSYGLIGPEGDNLINVAWDWTTGDPKAYKTPVVPRETLIPITPDEYIRERKARKTQTIKGPKPAWMKHPYPQDIKKGINFVVNRDGNTDRVIDDYIEHTMRRFNDGYLHPRIYPGFDAEVEGDTPASRAKLKAILQSLIDTKEDSPYESITLPNRGNVADLSKTNNTNDGVLAVEQSPGLLLDAPNPALYTALNGLRTELSSAVQEAWVTQKSVTAVLRTLESIIQSELIGTTIKPVSSKEGPTVVVTRGREVYVVTVANGALSRESQNIFPNDIIVTSADVSNPENHDWQDTPDDDSLARHDTKPEESATQPGSARKTMIGDSSVNAETANFPQPQYSVSKAASNDGDFVSLIADSMQSCCMILAGDSVGTGFVIGNGLILTCAHVVKDDLNKKPFEISFNRSKPIAATPVNFDVGVDAAILAFDPAVVKETVIPLQLGNSDTLQPGTPIFTIGSPEGIPSVVTMGIVASDRRRIPDVPKADSYFIDVDIHPGNSGGPVLNDAGQVIGLARGSIGDAEADEWVCYCVGINAIKAWLATL